MVTDTCDFRSGGWKEEGQGFKVTLSCRDPVSKQNLKEKQIVYIYARRFELAALITAPSGKQPKRAEGMCSPRRGTL